VSLSRVPRKTVRNQVRSASNWAAAAAGLRRHVDLAANARYPCHDAKQGLHQKDGSAVRPIKAPAADCLRFLPAKGLDMTTFDERERSYEAKFARDEELRFKATARRDRRFGAWAAAQLGLTGTAAEDYARDVARAEFKSPGDGNVLEKVLGDFKSKAARVDETAVKRKFVELMAEAVAEIEAGH
jgi:hypothetical protein